MMRKLSLLLLSLCSLFLANAQQVTPTADQIKAMTPEWTGERFPDGRPKVADKWLARLKNVALEEAWGILRNKG
ncbi:MAG TPA: RraA family protein, partial [Chitinophagaceae bacterium]|nr:RraA family protein [Chitinophagaceae bacterium]